MTLNFDYLYNNFEKEKSTLFIDSCGKKWLLTIKANFDYTEYSYILTCYHIEKKFAFLKRNRKETYKIDDSYNGQGETLNDCFKHVFKILEKYFPLGFELRKKLREEMNMFFVHESQDFIEVNSN